MNIINILSRGLAEARPVRRPRIGILRSLDGTPSASATRFQNSGGQALIMLLFFIMIGITITTTAIFIIAGNSLATSDIQQGEVARQMAETGAENALLQVLRGNFANESITVPDGTIAVTITSTDGTSTIDSVGTAGSYVKKVRVTVTKDAMINVTSWKEVNN